MGLGTPKTSARPLQGLKYVQLGKKLTFCHIDAVDAKT